jgi:hypothetical protein
LQQIKQKEIDVNQSSGLSGLDRLQPCADRRLFVVPEYASPLARKQQMQQ